MINRNSSVSKTQSDNQFSGQVLTKVEVKQPTVTFSENQTSSKIERHPVSGIVVRSKFKPLPSTSRFRRYIGSVQSQVKVAGNIDSGHCTNVYEVGARSLNAGEVFGKVSAEYEVQQPVRTADFQNQQLMTLHKKYSNFSGTFEFMDLSAILFHLGKSLGYFCNTGNLTCDDMRNGAPPLVLPLSRSADPINMSNHSLFIPRDSGCVQSKGAFYALTACASAYGTTVYTDVLAVDGNGSPVMVEPSGANLALACLHAARIVLSMYHDISHGSIAALAFYRGVHSAVSVVAHSDEGGYLRRVMRRGGYVRPYGGIYSPNASTFVGLPVPGGATASVICGVIDGLALLSAAEVAISAPIVCSHGGYFPTVYSGDSALDDETEDWDKAANSRFLASAIARDSYKFSNMYCKRLAKTLSLATIDDADALAATALQSCFDSLIDVGDRHLEYRSVAPYFWVEPTGLIQNEPTTDAQMAGFGVLACPGLPGQMSAFEKPEIIKDWGGQYSFRYKHRSARTSGWLIHCGYHRQDGLAYIKPAQFTASRFVMNKSKSASLRATHAGFDKYMWGRGQSKIPHPAESVYVNSIDLVCVALASSFDEETMQTRIMHTPMVSELSEKVTFIASTLREIDDGLSNYESKAVRRVREEGIVILENCRADWRTGIMANEGMLVFGEYDGPVLVNMGDRAHVQPDVELSVKVDDGGPNINKSGPPIGPAFNGNPSSMKPRPGSSTPKVVVSSNTVNTTVSVSAKTDQSKEQDTTENKDLQAEPAAAEANPSTGTGDSSLARAPPQ